MKVCIIYEKNNEEKIKMVLKNPELASKICSSLNQENYISEFYFIEYPIIDSEIIYD